MSRCPLNGASHRVGILNHTLKFSSGAAYKLKSSRLVEPEPHISDLNIYFVVFDPVSQITTPNPLQSLSKNKNIQKVEWGEGQLSAH